MTMRCFVILLLYAVLYLYACFFLFLTGSNKNKDTDEDVFSLPRHSFVC